MLKRLGQIRIGAIALIGGAALVVGTIVLVARQQHTASEKYEAAREERCTRSFPLDPKKQDACKHERDSGQNYLPWGYILVAWPEGITVWAIIGTGFVIAWQSNETRRAANAAQTSADAALKTVQAMIDSERPWVIAHMEQSKGPCLLDNGNVRFTWTVKNVGKSPAKLIEAGAMVSLDTLGPPLDQIEYKMESLDERILFPGDSVPFFVFWSKVENGQIRTRLGKPLEDFNDLVMVFGRIRYRGAVNTPGIYETRFSESSTVINGVCDGFEHHWPVDREDIRCT